MFPMRNTSYQMIEIQKYLLFFLLLLIVFPGVADNDDLINNSIEANTIRTGERYTANPGIGQSLTIRLKTEIYTFSVTPSQSSTPVCQYIDMGGNPIYNTIVNVSFDDGYATCSVDNTSDDTYIVTFNTCNSFPGSVTGDCPLTPYFLEAYWSENGVLADTMLVEKPAPITILNNQFTSLQWHVRDLDNEPIEYQATNLPPGLAMDDTGFISGYLSDDALGSYQSELTATNTSNETVTETLDWTIYSGRPVKLENGLSVQPTTNKRFYVRPSLGQKLTVNVGSPFRITEINEDPTEMVANKGIHCTLFAVEPDYLGCTYSSTQGGPYTIPYTKDVTYLVSLQCDLEYVDRDLAPCLEPHTISEISAEWSAAAAPPAIPNQSPVNITVVIPVIDPGITGIYGLPENVVFNQSTDNITGTPITIGTYYIDLINSLDTVWHIVDSAISTDPYIRLANNQSWAGFAPEKTDYQLSTQLGIHQLYEGNDTVYIVTPGANQKLTLRVLATNPDPVTDRDKASLFVRHGSEPEYEIFFEPEDGVRADRKKNIDCLQLFSNELECIIKNTLSGTYYVMVRTQKETAYTITASWVDNNADPALSLESSVNGQSTLKPGPAIFAGTNLTWTYEIRNDGGQELYNVEVLMRQKLPTLGNWETLCVLGTMDSGQTNRCEYFDLAIEGTYKSLVVVRGTTASGERVESTFDAFYQGIIITPALSLEVDANGQSALKPGPTINDQTAVWNYYVTNTGNITINNVVITGRQKLPVLGSWETLCTIGDILPNETKSCSTTEQTIAGIYKSLIVARGMTPDADQIESIFDAFYQGIITAPSLLVEVNANNQSACKPGPVISNETVNWEYSVTNTGNITINNVIITGRRKLPTLGDWETLCTIGDMLPNEKISCSTFESTYSGTYKALIVARGRTPDDIYVEGIFKAFYIGVIEPIP